MDDALQIRHSARVLAKVKTAKAAAPKRVPRTPFTVRQVDVLETALMTEPSDVDKAIAGFLLFCTSCRARFSDAQAVVEEPVLDTNPNGWGYITAEPREMKAKERVAVLLELLGRQTRLVVASHQIARP